VLDVGPKDDQVAGVLLYEGRIYEEGSCGV
jgi:hypothetical protein